MTDLLTEQDLDILIADRAIRLLALGNGRRIWEASPSPYHQMLIDDIRASIRPLIPADEQPPPCGCHHISDVYIRLPDSSLVRPDIAVFCTPPPRQRNALRIVPAAVIEVISPNYEAKDTEDLPPVYLANGVLDVIVVDSEQHRVLRFDADGQTTADAPVTLALRCGCRVTIAL
jgi:Uma2 family endonuclease